jgi:hypothetical protein
MFTRCCIGLGVALVASGARADVAEFTSAQAWQGAVEENYSTIDFTGFPDGTAISNQYSNLGDLPRIYVPV